MAHDGCILLFLILAIFAVLPPPPQPPPPLTARKIKILKTEKNSWRYHHFTHVYQKL